MTADAAATQATMGRRPWWAWPALALALLLSFAAVGLSSLGPMLHDMWVNPYGAFSHGYLVLLMCGWLGMSYWQRSQPDHIAPWWPAVIALILLALALALMDALFINSTRLVLIPFVALAAMATVFGRQVMSRLLWPSLFLFFALPQWWAINGVLQTITSKVVNLMVAITQLPAFIEGNFIHVPAGTFEIASGCSGLNYLIAALSLAGFYAFMHLQTWRNRLALMLAAAVLASISNWVRVYALIVIGIASDMQHYLIRVEHLYFGWVLFIVLTGPVLLYARRLELREQREEPIEVARAEVPPLVSPQVLLAAVVAGAILLIPRAVQVQPGSTAVVVQPLSASISDRPVHSTADGDWHPDFLNALTDTAAYGEGAERIDVFRAVYPHQTIDARVVRSENNVFGPGWRLAESGTSDARLPEQDLSVSAARGYQNERERIIWSWYWVAGAPTHTKLGAKSLELRGLLQRRRDAAVIALATDCLPDCKAAEERLRDFMQRSGDSLRWPPGQ